MLKGNYPDLAAFTAEHPEFREALEKAKKYDAAECGRHDINGDELYVSVQSYDTVAYDKKDFENHKKYIDIQYIVSGKEDIYVCGKSDMTVVKEYDGAGDYELLKENDPGAVSSVTLSSGDFLVLYPDEPHKPGISADGLESVKKIVIKVKY
ncbi:MAG: YhcH/YjgK/YiaL family protein [Clostridia bacterium]|nr:YhcH/YjgK/YiaL family protein [Clostridia bacterium]